VTFCEALLIVGRPGRPAGTLLKVQLEEAGLAACSLAVELFFEKKNLLDGEKKRPDDDEP
jgi:hypothetical protein